MCVALVDIDINIVIEVYIYLWWHFELPLRVSLFEVVNIGRIQTMRSILRLISEDS
jgi:hypothetical protein